MPLLDKISKIIDFAVKNEDNIKKVLSYLVKYGYLDPEKDISLEDILDKVHKLHNFAGVLFNGNISGKTLSIMELPRCSMTDAESAVVLPKWAKNELTYCIASRDKDISVQEWDQCFRKAFDNWSNVCNLKFTQVETTNANLLINVGRGARDDFDGPSGTLAWFQLPTNSNYQGQLQGKFDADELWNTKILLVNVSCHEIGHALGISHHNVPRNLMNPFYDPNISAPQTEDIRQSVLRYGKPSVITPNIPPIPTIPTSPNETLIKIKGSIDTISIDGYRVQKLS